MKKIKVKKLLEATKSKMSNPYRRHKNEIKEKQNKISEFKDLNNKPENPIEIYNALMNLYIHYDRQFWSRMQLLIAVQSAGIIGSYNLKDTQLSVLILILTFFLTIAIVRLIYRDIMNKDENKAVMDILAHRLTPPVGSFCNITLGEGQNANYYLLCLFQKPNVEQNLVERELNTGVKTVKTCAKNVRLVRRPSNGII